MSKTLHDLYKFLLIGAVVGMVDGPYILRIFYVGEDPHIYFESDIEKYDTFYNCLLHKKFIDELNKDAVKDDLIRSTVCFNAKRTPNGPKR
jgi:hypothetical protein